VVRLEQSRLDKAQQERWCDVYHNVQTHGSLQEFLEHHVQDGGLQAQITTHSKLLSTQDVEQLDGVAGVPKACIYSLALQAFGTEQQFSRQLR